MDDKKFTATTVRLTTELYDKLQIWLAVNKINYTPLVVAFLEKLTHQEEGVEPVKKEDLGLNL